VSSSLPIPAASGSVSASRPRHFLADLYSFDLSTLSFCEPAVSTVAVALCLFVGLGIGHPGAALLAGGGALTIGFGINQRICDSRLLPMLFGVLAMASATLAGSLAGHRGFAIVIASAISAAIYGVLTLRNAGVAWVGQQASIALFVASAFPSSVRAGLVRAGLIAAGGVVQILITSLALHMIPELRENIAAAPRSIYSSLNEARRLYRNGLQGLSEILPAPSRRVSLVYAARLMITVALSTELYRRIGLQSGYWIPMTALLVQKPAFSETFTRALSRVAGTMAGAILSTILISHVTISPPLLNWALAAATCFFAFWSFATLSVNYGIYSLCLTSYIVFLLSLNQIPGPEIAHRRALSTVAGAAIALLVHLDALRRHRRGA
jgi:hypothetical protein